MKINKFMNDHLGWMLFLLVFFWVIYAYAGTNNLTTVPAGKFKRSHINQYLTALGGDFLPRNSSGVVTDEGGSLGDSTRDWLKAFIASGGWEAGDVKMHHSFNGVVTCGHGWMLMDGRQITEANYNTEHGAGTWDTYVVSSPIENLYMPDMDGAYAVGVDGTTSTGIGAPPTHVGNTSHQIDIQHTHVDNGGSGHTHTMTAHQHRWYNWDGTNSTAFSWSGDGGTWGISHNTCVSGSDDFIATWVYTQTDDCLYNNDDAGGDWYTENTTSVAGSTAVSLDNSLSTTQSIQPESVQFQFCMRIIN